MGSEKHNGMLLWTKEEYLKFAEVMMDKPQSYYAFEVLYWCGIREGELLALTPAAINRNYCCMYIFNRCNFYNYYKCKLYGKKS